MGAFFSISFWIALATVIPGFMTVGVLHLCIAAAGLEYSIVETDSVVIGVVVAIMVLTQASGILLEEFLIRFQLLGSDEQHFSVPDPRRTGEVLQVAINPYKQYDVIYGLLVQLGRDEDPHRHLERALAQFFLTNNSLVAFGLGSLLAFGLVFGVAPVERSGALVSIGIGCLICLVVSHRVAVIRFRVVAESVWALRKLRTLPHSGRPSELTNSEPS